MQVEPGLLLHQAVVMVCGAKLQEVDPEWMCMVAQSVLFRLTASHPVSIKHAPHSLWSCWVMLVMLGVQQRSFRVIGWRPGCEAHVGPVPVVAVLAVAVVLVAGGYGIHSADVHDKLTS